MLLFTLRSTAYPGLPRLTPAYPGWPQGVGQPGVREEVHMSRSAGRTPDAASDPNALRAGGALLQAQRDKSQAQLQQAQRLENLGELAGGVAHDFNNLLAVILNYVTFASEGLAAAPGPGGPGRWESARSALRQSNGAGERAPSLTRQLLAFARRE